MSKILKIRYTLESGSLPPGMKLNPDTGAITGATGFDALGLGPTWTGPSAGSLGSYDEGDTLATVTLSATSDNAPVMFSMATDQDRLPWGVQLNPMTGEISGTIAPLKLRTKEEASTSDGPTWVTPFGRLAGYDEGSSASIQLTATPLGSRTLRSFQVVDGYLPWGLKLDPITGTISGTTSRLKVPGPYVDVPKLPLPVWNTNQNLGEFREFDSVNLTLVATPDAGRSMTRYGIVSGALPWGLRLNQATGAITGSLVEIRKRNEPVFIDPANPPVIKDTIQYQPQDQAVQNLSVTDGGNIVTLTKGAQVASLKIFSSQFDDTPTRTMFVTGYLPLGLRTQTITRSATETNLDITGTVSNAAFSQTGVFTFTVTAVSFPDANYMVKTTVRTYTITVQ